MENNFYNTNTDEKKIKVKGKNRILKFRSILLLSLIIIFSLSACSNESTNEEVSKTNIEAENKLTEESKAEDKNTEKSKQEDKNTEGHKKKNTSKHTEEVKVKVINDSDIEKAKKLSDDYIDENIDFVLYIAKFGFKEVKDNCFIHTYNASSEQPYRVIYFQNALDNKCYNIKLTDGKLALNEIPRMILDRKYFTEMSKKIFIKNTKKDPLNINILQEFIKVSLYNISENNIISGNGMSSEEKELSKFEILTPIGYKVNFYNEDNNEGDIEIYTKEGFILMFNSDNIFNYGYGKYESEVFEIELQRGYITAVDINDSEIANGLPEEENTDKSTTSETGNNDVNIDENTENKLNNMLFKYSENKGYEILSYHPEDFNDDKTIDIALLCRINSESVSISILDGTDGKVLVEKIIPDFVGMSQSEKTSFSLENVISSSKKQIYINTLDGTPLSRYLFNYVNGDLINLYDKLHISPETSIDYNKNIICTFTQLDKKFAININNPNYDKTVYPEDLSFTLGPIVNKEIGKIEVIAFVRCYDIVGAPLAEITQEYKWDGNWILKNVEMKSCFDGITIYNMDKSDFNKDNNAERLLNIRWFRIPDKIESDFQPNIIKFTNEGTLYSSFGAHPDTGEEIFSEDKYEILSIDKNIFTINLQDKGEMTLKLLDNGTKLEIYDSNNKLFFHGLIPEEWGKKY